MGTCMQSFGRYDTAQQAAEAYDIGCILFKGREMRLNFSAATFLDDATGTFREDLDLTRFSGVARSVSKSLEGKGRKGETSSAESGPEIVHRGALQSLFRVPLPQLHEAFVRIAGLEGDLGLGV
jgi:hypothetical protein